MIGSGRLPRCFAHLPNPSYPCGAQYFSNEKAWMRTEIMVTILTRLNNRLKREERHIILFLDNAPCHPPSLTDTFSNIKVTVNNIWSKFSKFRVFFFLLFSQRKHSSLICRKKKLENLKKNVRYNEKSVLGELVMNSERCQNPVIQIRPPAEC